MNRFDHIEFNEEHIIKRARIKAIVESLDKELSALYPGRSRALAQTSLEELYMWIGKAIRDNQTIRAEI